MQKRSFRAAKLASTLTNCIATTPALCLLLGLPTGIPAAAQVIAPPPCAPQCTTFNVDLAPPPGEYQGVNALRIASGRNGGTWAIAEEPFDANGNKKILEWTGAGFAVRDGGAVAVAVDDRGAPWVVSAQGNIFRRNLSSPTGWDLMPGLAKHIAAGRPAPNGSGLVWVIGTGETEDGNYEIYKWNGSDGWERAVGEGVKLAVDGSACRLGLTGRRKGGSMDRRQQNGLARERLGR